MDDYHEFCDAHEVNIEEWHMYWSPNYFSITNGRLAASTPTHQPLSQGLVHVLLCMGVMVAVQLSRHGFFPLLTLSPSSLKSFAPIIKV
jgi:hypothetical protein